METLEQIWKRLKDGGYETDKGSTHSYIDVYEKLLQPYRDTALNVLEIGLFWGHSLRMWSEYFSKAKIYGIDCSLTPHDGMADLRPMIKEGWHINIFDAEDKAEVEKRFSNIRFDVIIEDAGHEINQQLNLYKIWSQYLTKDGIYIIEDVQDIDRDMRRLQVLDGTVIDLREIKNRYDDVLMVIK